MTVTLRGRHLLAVLAVVLAVGAAWAWAARDRSWSSQRCMNAAVRLDSGGGNAALREDFQRQCLNQGL